MKALLDERWLKVDGSSVGSGLALPLHIFGRARDQFDLLEEEDVRLWFMHLVMFPA